MLHCTEEVNSTRKVVWLTSITLTNNLVHIVMGKRKRINKYFTRKLMNQLSLSLGFLGHVTLTIVLLKWKSIYFKTSAHHSRWHFISSELYKYLAFRTSKCLVSSILFGRNMGCTFSGFWHNLLHCSSCKAWCYDQTISYWWGTACYTKSSVNFSWKFRMLV